MSTFMLVLALITLTEAIVRGLYRLQHHPEPLVVPGSHTYIPAMSSKGTVVVCAATGRLLKHSTQVMSWCPSTATVMPSLQI